MKKRLDRKGESSEAASKDRREKSMTYLITGVGGQLGHDLMNELAKRGLEAVGTDILPEESYRKRLAELGENPGRDRYIQVDITNEEDVMQAFSKIQPDFLIHCAAWTAVDAAEEEENRATVYAVNVTGTGNLAKACRKTGIPMIYISTDYVFHGQGEEPWQPDDRNYAPLNYYGKTKLQGEEQVSSLLEKYFIVRIAWVFGRNGKNFIRTMLKLAENHDHLRVVCDQIGTPTYTYDLARLLADMSLTDKYGYYHATNEGGYISWYDFTREIFRQAAEKQIPALSGISENGQKTVPAYEKVTVDPVTTAEYGLSKAARPFNSRLDKKKLSDAGFEPLPDWRDALSRYLDALKETEERKS